MTYDFGLPQDFRSAMRAAVAVAEDPDTARVRAGITLQAEHVTDPETDEEGE